MMNSFHEDNNTVVALIFLVPILWLRSSLSNNGWNNWKFDRKCCLPQFKIHKEIDLLKENWMELHIIRRPCVSCKSNCNWNSNWCFNELYKFYSKELNASKINALQSLYFFYYLAWFIKMGCKQSRFNENSFISVTMMHVHILDEVWHRPLTHIQCN